MFDAYFVSLYLKKTFLRKTSYLIISLKTNAKNLKEFDNGLSGVLSEEEVRYYFRLFFAFFLE